MELALAQYGVLSRKQATAAGVSAGAFRWLTRSGGWVPVLPGIIRAPGAAESWRQWLKALCLWAEPDVAVSHRAAAALWGFAGFPEGILEIETAKNTRIRNLGPLVVVHQRRPELHCVTAVEGIPVTNRCYTLMELGAVASRAQVRTAVDDALRREEISVQGINWMLQHYGGHGIGGAATLGALMRDRPLGYLPPESPLEGDFASVVSRAHLEMPQRQVTLPGGRVDFYYPQYNLVIEGDGFAPHATRAQFQEDRRRDNEHVADGRRVLRFTWDDIANRPGYVVMMLRRAGVGGATRAPATGRPALR